MPVPAVTTEPAEPAEPNGPEATAPPNGAVRRARLTVLMAALVALAVKLVTAATTYGTRDFWHWSDFADAVRAHGPVGVYAVHFQRSFYNHPPGIGYLLELLQWDDRHGVTLNFSIRGLASLADFGTALLVFELLRRRRPLSQAQWAGVGVALSPVLYVISGFHGNTDPIFVFLVLLGAYLLIDRLSPTAAGVALALAISVKIVPVVVLLTVGLVALRAGRRTVLRLAAGFVVPFGLIWGPALLRQPTALRHNVGQYAGSGPSQWGTSQLARWIGSDELGRLLSGSGRFVVVLVCVVVPAALYLAGLLDPVLAIALSLVLFLFLTPAFGTQYLAWGVAASYLISRRWATAFSLLAGAILVWVYTRWDDGIPWYFARTWGLTKPETIAMFGAWITLGGVVITGLGMAFTHRARAETDSVKTLLV